MHNRITDRDKGYQSMRCSLHQGNIPYLNSVLSSTNLLKNLDIVDRLILSLSRKKSNIVCIISLGRRLIRYSRFIDEPIVLL
jgi:hypothetical protein